MSARLVAEINEERRRLRSSAHGVYAIACCGVAIAQRAYNEACR